MSHPTYIQVGKYKTVKFYKNNLHNISIGEFCAVLGVPTSTPVGQLTLPALKKALKHVDGWYYGLVNPHGGGLWHIRGPFSSRLVAEEAAREEYS